jgi:hypothetical protein
VPRAHLPCLPGRARLCGPLVAITASLNMGFRERPMSQAGGGVYMTGIDQTAPVAMERSTSVFDTG